MVWEALTTPNRDPRRVWLIPHRGEVPPRVIEADRPHLVVWSSLWTNRPGYVIRFDLEPAGQGTSLRWTLLAPDEPAPEVVGGLRWRMNELINARLRYSFGQ
ncbi:conserved hypothetical protein [Frankia canadensis]|uniref:Polyketide cyclase / dehydrase and lipid transport n=1 Tax=Frankia canadensis TaxID=1836972 RepID=A0A2I2KVC4_9ACTN|nr:conserved hypothetical protein [Frankia canadensis]SOU56896.1 conserved hypothetical protein [Frankia canadensis]